MGKVKVSNSSDSPIRKRAAITPEARQNQMISYAMDLVEQRLLNGTASSQETTHFLKLATKEQQAKIEKLERENELLRAKTESIQSQKRSEELFAEAIKAFGIYSGRGRPTDDEEDDDYDY